MGNLAELTAKVDAVWPLLDERTRRLMAASEAMALGYGGLSLVHRACGLSRNAIVRGIEEIDADEVGGEGRTRRPGAGRKALTVSDPRLLATLDRLIDDQTRGDPESPPRWICKNTRTIAKELSERRHPISHTKVAQLLHGSTTAFKVTERPKKGAIIQLATHSFGISMARSGGAWRRGGR